jgi:hypothetical protein
MLVGTLTQNNFWSVNLGAHCVDDDSGCTAQEMFDAIHARRGGESGIILWDLAPWVKAANLGEYNDWANELKTIMDTEYLVLESSSDYYNIGLSGVVSATGNPDAVLDLISEQETTGEWTSGNGAAQDTAYAVMALMSVGQTDAVINGVNYLVDSQLAEGGWSNPENTEVTSEAVQALFDFGDIEGPSITNVYIEPDYPNLDSTLVKVYATIIDEWSGVDYATLYYRVGDEEVQITTFRGPFSGGYAGISIGDPKDNVLVRYYIKAVDNVENIAWEPSSGWKSFTYDGSTPTTTDDAPDEWVHTDVEVTLTCVDTISGCQETYYSTDGSEPTTLYETSFTLSETGQYQLEYYSVDNAGNIEGVVTGTLVKIDMEDPVITDNYVNDGVWVNLEQIVTLNPTDTGDSGINEVKYCEGLSCVPSSGTLLEVLYQLIFDNSQDTIIRYQTWDYAENPSSVGEFNVLIDMEIPETNDDVPIDWQTSAFDVSLTVVEDGFSPMTTYYKVWEFGETEPEECIQENLISINVDGEYSIKYYSEDEAGNVESEQTAGNLAKLDSLQPSLDVQSISQIYADDFTLQVTESDETSGIDLCEYRVNSGSWLQRNCNSNTPPITVGEGEECVEGENSCEVEVRVSDYAGNIATQSKVFSIDWTNPPMILNSGPSGTLVNGWAVLSVETNKPATCKYDTVYKSSYDSMSFVMESSGGVYHSNPLTDLLDKSYSYYVLCKDNAGHEMSYPASITFDVDTRENFVVTIPETKGNYFIEGWNQFFLPSFVLDDTTLISPYTVETVLESIGGQYNIIYHYDGTIWRSYEPDRPVNDLIDLTEFNGGGFPYFIDMAVAGGRLELA